MSSEIETMLYVGETPWHGFGTFVGDEPVTSDQALILSGLDWQVREEPLFAGTIPVETHKAIVRSTDSRILGVVGKEYRPLQNFEAFSVMDSLVAEGCMRYHTAGSLRNGQRVWMLGKIGSVDVVPQDRVDQYLFLFNAHDGSHTLRILFTTTRVVCANTARIALHEGRGDGVSVRHTKNLKKRVENAAEVLGIARKKHQENADFLKLLARTPLNSRLFDDFARIIVPDPVDPDANPTKADNQRDVLTVLFESGRGQDIPGVTGTAWAALNAVTEYVNYCRISRGGNKAQERRFEGSIFGSGSDIIETANQALFALANTGSLPTVAA